MPSSGLLKKFLEMVDDPGRIMISPAYDLNKKMVDITPTYKAIENYAFQIGETVKLAERSGISGRIVYIPVWRNNEEMNQSDGRAEIYLPEMRSLLDRDMKYLWNGCSWNSYHTSNTDLLRIKSLLGTDPVWWDNSMLYSDELAEMDNQPAKLNLFNLFMPFGNQSIRDLFNNIDTTQVFINFCPVSELDIIRLSTLSDFLWNTRDYDPDISLWKTLQSKYGAACAKELVLFADIYAVLLRLSAELKDPVHHQRLIRKALPLQEALDEHLVSIKNLIGSEHQLVKELQLKSEGINSKIPLPEPE